MSDPTRTLFSIIKSLEHAKIYYELSCQREGYLMISVSVPGQRWEVEVNEDGGVEIEKFLSNGEIHDADALADLYAQFSD